MPRATTVTFRQSYPAARQSNPAAGESVGRLKIADVGRESERPLIWFVSILSHPFQDYRANLALFDFMQKSGRKVLLQVNRNIQGFNCAQEDCSRYDEERLQTKVFPLGRIAADKWQNHHNQRELLRRFDGILDKQRSATGIVYDDTIEQSEEYRRLVLAADAPLRPALLAQDDGYNAAVRQTVLDYIKRELIRALRKAKVVADAEIEGPERGAKLKQIQAKVDDFKHQIGVAQADEAGLAKIEGFCRQFGVNFRVLYNNSEMFVKRETFIYAALLMMGSIVYPEPPVPALAYIHGLLKTRLGVDTVAYCYKIKGNFELGKMTVDDKNYLGVVENTVSAAAAGGEVASVGGDEAVAAAAGARPAGVDVLLAGMMAAGPAVAAPAPAPAPGGERRLDERKRRELSAELARAHEEDSDGEGDAAIYEILSQRLTKNGLVMERFMGAMTAALQRHNGSRREQLWKLFKEISAVEDQLQEAKRTEEEARRVAEETRRVAERRLETAMFAAVVGEEDVPEAQVAARKFIAGHKQALMGVSVRDGGGVDEATSPLPLPAGPAEVEDGAAGGAPKNAPKNGK